MEFRGKSFSESMGNSTGSTGVSSRTGVTGDVLGKGRGTEYGFGRIKSFGIGWSAKIDGFCWGEVTRSKTACIGVFTGEGEDERLRSMVIGRIYVRCSSDGKGRGPGVAHAIMDSLGTGGGHTTFGAAKAPRRANNCLIKVPRPAFRDN